MIRSKTIVSSVSLYRQDEMMKQVGRTTGIIFLGIILQLICSLPVSAASYRFAVLIDESVNGVIPTVPLAQGEVEKGLLEKGFELVDKSQVAAARKDSSIELLIKGQVPDSLSAMDADFLVAGKVGASSLGTVMDSDFHVFSAGIKVSVVRVSTGQILKTFTAEVRGDGLSDGKAARKAQANAGKRILKELLQLVPQLRARAEKIEIIVEGVPGPVELAELAEKLKGIDEIDKIGTSYQSRRLSKLEATSLIGAMNLALKLDQAVVPVKVVASSSGRILARWEPGRALRLRMILASGPARLPKGLRWLRSSFKRMAISELENVRFLDVVNTTGNVGTRPSPKAISRLASENGSPALVAVSRLSKAGKGIVAEVTVYDGRRGKKFCSVAASDRPERITALVHVLSQKLERKILRTMAGKRRFKLPRLANVHKLSREALQSSKSNDLPLSIDSVRVDDIFPSRMGFYVDNPIGRLKLRRTGKKQINEVKVSIFVPGFMKLPSEIVITHPESKQIAVPLKVTLDSDRIFLVDENTPAQAEIKVFFKTSDGTGVLHRVVAMMVFDKNAIDWKVPDSAAAFVTAREKGLSLYARAAMSAVIPESLPAGLAKPVSLFETMRLRKLRYLKDPVNPSRTSVLDYVQYPRETLEYRTGDCDDLAVLYSALLESVGVETALVYTPGHVMFAFRLDQALSSITRITFDQEMYLTMADLKDVHSKGLRATAFRVDASRDHVMLVDRPDSGQVWLPIETTSLDVSFADAWQRGAKEIRRWKKTPENVSIIRVRQAWKKFPSVSLPVKNENFGMDEEALAKAIENVANELVIRREKSIQRRLAEIEKRLKRRPKDTSSRSKAAWLLTMVRRTKDARIMLDKGLELSPHNAALLNNLANLSILDGHVDDALKYYHRAVDSDPLQAGRVYANLALVWSLLGDKDRTQSAMEESLRHGGQNLFAQKGLIVEGDLERRAGADKAKPGSLDEREIRLLLHNVIKKQKRSERVKPKDGKQTSEMFSNPYPSGGRRGADPRTHRLTIDQLFWAL